VLRREFFTNAAPGSIAREAGALCRVSNRTRRSRAACLFAYRSTAVHRHGIRRGRRAARVRLRDCPAILGASRRGEKPKPTSPGRRPAAVKSSLFARKSASGARAATISPGLSPAPVVREPLGPQQKIDHRAERLEHPRVQATLERQRRTRCRRSALPRQPAPAPPRPMNLRRDTRHRSRDRSQRPKMLPVGLGHLPEPEPFCGSSP